MASNLYNIFLKFFLKSKFNDEIKEKNVLFLQLAIIHFPHMIYSYITKKEDKVVIRDKYIYTINGYSKLMIVDDKKKHFCVNNSLWYWKWNSLEDFVQLKIGKCYKVSYYGYRIALLGIFPNIFFIFSENDEIQKKD